MRPSIETVKKLQARCDLRDTHVLWLDYTGSVIAHTDKERATIDLEDCELHKRLLEHGPPSSLDEPGYFTASPRPVDGYSESFRSDDIGWVFKPLNL